MSTIYGNWAVTWSDSDHSGVNRQHLLRVPLQRIRPAVSVNKHTAVSLDYSTQNTVVFGSAYEIAAKIKAEDNTQSLADLIEAGMKGVTLTLVDLSQTDRTVDVYLIDPADAWLATYDMQGTPWEFEAELRFRRTSGTAFPDWLLYQAYGPNGLLFKYTPGMDLSGATFTRAAAANYINVNGVTTAAATNVARDAHHQTVSSTWTRTLRVYANTDSDNIYFPFTHTPQAMSVYVKYIARLDAGARVFEIGGASGDAFYWTGAQNSATGWKNEVRDAAGYQTDTLALDYSAGDLIEGVWRMDGTNIDMVISVAGGAETASTGTTYTADSTFSAERLYVGSEGTAAENDMDLIEIKVAAGVQTMAHMRSL